MLLLKKEAFMMENALKATKNMIECPNCHFVLDYDESLCSECKFDLVVKDYIKIEDEMTLKNN
jgi:hypothetical protein